MQLHKKYTEQQLKKNRDYLIGNLASCRKGWLIQMSDRWLELLESIENEMRSRKIEVLTIKKISS
jgi:hypothetical protein